MSPLTEPTRLVLRRTWQPMDPDAAAYITAVEAADTAAGSPGGLEERTKIAIDNFVLGCKADGIWTAIKASCILAGARTLAGALQPLVGAEPTNVGPFVSGDYNRKTGLVGDGSTKYLNSNQNNNANPQNNKHIAVYATTRNTEDAIRCYIGTTFVNSTSYSSQLLSLTPRKLTGRLHDSTSVISTGDLHSANGLFAASRNNSSNYTLRGSSVSEIIASASNPPTSNNIFVFNRNLDGSANLHSNARLAFYSIGESLDLALLDTRVTDLINAFATAIP